MDEHPRFAQRYRAVQSRDARFDGQFIFAVSSTGIYCRPSCPARAPKPQNVTFYTTSAAAHQAGYRACRRCLPDAAPGSPEWNIRQDLSSRAMRLIREGIMNEGGVAELSRRLGYSTRHIQRTLHAELGAGPLALARAHRAQTARTLLVATDLPISEAVFAAGFTSSRQFNETLREIFGTSPSDIRARRRPSPRAAVPPEAAEPAPQAHHRLTLDLDLPVREPFDAPGVFRFLAQRAVAGVEAAQLAENCLLYARTLRLRRGAGALQLTATPQGPRWRVHLRCEVASLADVPAVVSAARHLLDLDADPVAAGAALAHDPALAPLVRRTPGIRLPGIADVQEYLFRAIVGQQISVAAARTHLSRFAAAAGTGYKSTIEGLSTLFPTAGEILAAVPDPSPDGGPLDPERPLRLPARSIRTIRHTAAAWESGQLQIDRGTDPAALHQQLTAIAGIGEWTSSYLALRALGHPDVWMRGDVALVAGAENLKLLDPEISPSAAHRALAHRAQRWSPWRSYAAMHLWNAAATPPKGPYR